MIAIDINNDEVVRFTNKLESLTESALPKAVRGTLNGLALDMKKNTIQDSFDKSFTKRQKNFVKVASSVNFARGFNIDNMESQAGFRNLSKGNNQAVEDLETQEFGGRIDGRSFIPTNAARISKNKGRIVSRKNRIGGIKNIVKADNSKEFVKSIHIAGKGGHVLYNDMLFEVSNIRKRDFKLKAIYSFKKGRSVKIEATHFMERATKKTLKKADDIFIKEAEFRIKRHFK